MNLQSTVRDLESKAVLDFLTWGKNSFLFFLSRSFVKGTKERYKFSWVRRPVHIVRLISNATPTLMS